MTRKRLIDDPFADPSSTDKEGLLPGDEAKPTKKSTAKKSTAKKSTKASKTPTKKAPASTSTKETAKKATAKKATAKKATAKKAPAKKVTKSKATSAPTDVLTLEALQTELEAIKESLDAQQQAYSAEHKEQLEALSTQWEETYTSQIEALQASLSQNQETLDALQEQLEGEEDEGDEASLSAEDIEPLEESISKLHTQQSEQSKSFASLQEQLTALQEQLTALQEQLVASTDTTQLQEQLTALQEQLEGEDEEGEEGEEDAAFEELQEQLTALQEQIESFASLQEQLSGLQTQIETLQSSVVQTQTHQEEQASQLDERFSALATQLEERTSPLETQLAQSLSQLGELREVLAERETDHDQQLASVASHDELEPLREQLAALQESLEEREPTGLSDEIQEALSALQEKLIALESLAKDNQASLSALEEAARQASETHDEEAEEEAYLEQLEAFAQLQETIEKFEGRLQELSTLEGRLQEVQSSLESPPSSDSGGEALTSLQESLSTLEERLQEMQSALEGLPSDGSGGESLQDALSQLSELATLQESLSSLETRLDQIESSLEALPSLKDSLAEGRQDASSDNEALQTQLETLQGLLRDEERTAQLQALRDKLSSLEEALGGHTQKLQEQDQQSTEALEAKLQEQERELASLRKQNAAFSEQLDQVLQAVSGNQPLPARAESRELSEEEQAAKVSSAYRSNREAYRKHLLIMGLSSVALFALLGFLLYLPRLFPAFYLQRALYLLPLLATGAGFFLLRGLDFQRQSLENLIAKEERNFNVPPLDIHPSSRMVLLLYTAIGLLVLLEIILLFSPLSK